MKLEKNLEYRNVILRNYTKEDRRFCADMWMDPENGKYMSDPERKYLDAGYLEALYTLQDSEDVYYLIAEDRDTGKRIGSSCIVPEGDTVDIGYCVTKEEWRKGYGYSILQCIIAWCQEHDYKAITAEAAKENKASCGLLEKCGFTVIKDTEFKKYNMDIVYPSSIYRLEINQ